jgi:hypothetical protein
MTQNKAAEIKSLIGIIEIELGKMDSADRAYAQGVVDGLARAAGTASFEASVGRSMSVEHERSYLRGIIDGLQHAAGIADVSYKFTPGMSSSADPRDWR